MKTIKKLSLLLTGLVLASAVLMTSCKKKEKDEDPDKDTTAASDNNTAEWIANDAVTMGGQASESGSVSYKGTDNNSIMASCATISTNTATPQMVTVNFSGSLCNDGHIRSGALHFDFSGSTSGATAYRHPGFKCVITSSNYIVDQHTVTINHTVTNTTPVGFDPNTTNLTWAITGTVTVVKPNSGGTINWNCTRTKTLMNTKSITYPSTGTQTVVAAYTDPNTAIDWSKAVISLSGNANGTTAKGESYSFSTTSPLVVNMNCTPNPNKPGRHPIVQGSFEFTPAGKGKRVVDFGNGSCDFLCEITVYTVSGIKYGPVQYQFDN